MVRDTPEFRLVHEPKRLEAKVVNDGPDVSFPREPTESIMLRKTSQRMDMNPIEVARSESNNDPSLTHLSLD